MILIDKEKFIEEVMKRKYSAASIKLIEEQPEVKAIPVNWIKENYAYYGFLKELIEHWEKENDKQ